ncbi:hypothetical protein PROPHIGD54-2_17 [Mycobacterium phage prophiGD54-2]|uniref:hypothetical protein n=1 Tax=Mycobacteroides abscessus TaxID=36809 RepID=UPI0019D265CC|nr:hypothetical protein [Mycobacteroides abscessus]QSM04617.1 hypothetical protein PROPHIGD54-2_17 [Mycobacterium phage prophiGD54-2]QSN19675.1 hypothetical protein I3U41_17360 [Mycobacteroides abscessus subsp. abscessus]
MSAARVHSDQPSVPFVGWEWRVTLSGPCRLSVELLTPEGEPTLQEEVDILNIYSEGALLDVVHSAMRGMREEAIAAAMLCTWLKNNWGIEC